MRIALFLAALFLCLPALASEPGQPLDCSDWMFRELGHTCDDDELTVQTPVTADSYGGLFTLIPVVTFPLLETDIDGIAIDESTIYAPLDDEPVMHVYDLVGTFLNATPLTGVSTYLGGYVDVTIRSSTELYLVARFPLGQGSAIYRFTKTGVFLDQTNITPENAHGIGYDGTDVYVTQNWPPYEAYRMDPETGTILQIYPALPEIGQQLGATYWDEQDLMVVAYDAGLALRDPSDGAVIQFIANSDLGGQLQTFGVDVVGDTFYVLAWDGQQKQVQIYTADSDTGDGGDGGVPAVGGFGAMLTLLAVAGIGIYFVRRGAH